MEILSFFCLFYLIVYMMHSIMLSYCIRNIFGLMIVMYILISWLLRTTSNQYDLDLVFSLKLTAKHANLPSTLSIFSNFLLGEIFSQVGRLFYSFVLYLTCLYT